MINKDELNKCFMSAEYKAGYEKGRADGFKETAICLIIVVALVVVFG